MSNPDIKKTNQKAFCVFLLKRFRVRVTDDVLDLKGLRFYLAYLHRVKRHEHSKAAQMVARTNSVSGIGLLLRTAIFGPDPFLMPVRTDVSEVRGFILILKPKPTRQRDIFDRLQWSKEANDWLEWL